MNDAQRRALLADLKRLGPASEHNHDPVRTFLPLHAHDAALRPETLVVRGERGAGKTALFRFIQAVGDSPARTRAFPNARLENTTWVEGFSEGTGHPQALNLEQFGESASAADLRIVWLVHLAGVLGRHTSHWEGFPPGLRAVWEQRANDPAAWVATAKVDLASLSSYLDDTERRLGQTRQTVVVAYDYLDRIGVLADPKVREGYTGSLLAMWASYLGRYQWLRSKVFVREDLFDAAKRAFPDASKLEARSVSLAWSREALYRMLIRQMASASEPLLAWTRKAVKIVDDGDLGPLPPEALPELGASSQKAFVDRLAGATMGSGARKGFTYRWMLNHLQDAHVRVVPRSLVNLVAIAADQALIRGPQATASDQLLHPTELAGALDETSERRVAELKEEHQIVERLSRLRGAVVLLARRQVVKKLDDAGDGEAVFRELVNLGVLSVRADGRIDVPDLYRYGYGIKRKGGVARPK
jgi:hypothetical protein